MKPFSEFYFVMSRSGLSTIPFDLAALLIFVLVPRYSELKNEELMNKLCVYLFSKKNIFPDILASQAKTYQYEYSSVLDLMSTFLTYPNFEKLVQSRKFPQQGSLLYLEYYNELRKQYFCQDEPNITENHTTQEFHLFDYLPDDIKYRIYMNADILDILISFRQICRVMKQVFNQEYVVQRTEYKHLITSLSEKYDPNKLYCFWFVNCMFKTVDDLVRYRYTLSSETMKPAWSIMIYRGATKYKSYAHDIVIRSALCSYEKHRRLTLNLPLPLDDLVYLYDMSLSDQKLSKAFIELFLAKVDHQQSLQMILTCKGGVCILKAGLEYGYFWGQLMTLEEPLPEDIAACLREYNEAHGLNNVSIPFTSQNIRDYAERILSKLINIDRHYRIYARILKAFSEVRFDNIPVFKVDYDAFIRYLMKSPHLLSVQQFTLLLQHLKANGFIKLNEVNDKSCHLVQ
jgi:hypothetical protein